MGAENFLRMRVSGETIDPPLKVTVLATGEYGDTDEVFLYDQQLDDENLMTMVAIGVPSFIVILGAALFGISKRGTKNERKLVAAPALKKSSTNDTTVLEDTGDTVEVSAK